MRQAEVKTFKTDTLAGIKAAERYKAKLENKYETVRVLSAGLDRVQIYGTNHDRAQ